MGIIVEYIVPTMLILYTFVYFIAALALTGSVETETTVTKESKLAGIFFNTFALMCFISILNLNLVNYNNSLSLKFVLTLIIYHGFNIIYNLLVKEKTSTYSFTSRTFGIFVCLYIAFGTWIFLL